VLTKAQTIPEDEEMEVDYSGNDEENHSAVDLDDDKETHGEEKSRASSHRSSCTKSRGDKAKRLINLKAFAEKNAKKLGIPFVWVDDDHSYMKTKEERRAAAKAALVPLAPDEPPPGHTQATVRPDVFVEYATGRDEIDTYAALKEAADKYRFTPDELRQLALEREQSWLPKFQMVPTDTDMRMRIHNQWMEQRKFDAWTDWWWCSLCGKWADDKHAQSKVHIDRLDETTAMSQMFGECCSMRRFEPSNGLPILCDKKSFKEYWGSRIEELPRILQDRLRRGATVAVRWGGTKCKPKMLAAADITGTQLVCATFLPGSGKYLKPEGMEQDYGFRYEDLPEEGPRDYGTFERLIPDDGIKTRHEPPKNHGWWPVVSLQWKGMHKDFDFPDEQSYQRAVTKGQEPLWAPCVYQIVDGDGNVVTVIDAWPIRVTYYR
jgi:hypothetical protein